MTERSDEELMGAFVAGQAEAFDLLLQRHQSGLFAFLARQLGDSALAEDLFQEVFLRVVRHRHQFRSDGRFAPWLYQIARHACVDQHRRARLRAADSLDHPAQRDGPAGECLADRMPAAGEDPEAQVLRAELKAAVDEFLTELPSEQREVFLLRTDAELSFPEIAETLGCPLDTAKSRMRYAVATLRRRFGIHPVARVSGGGR